MKSLFFAVLLAFSVSLSAQVTGSAKPAATLAGVDKGEAPVLPPDQVVLTVGDRKITYSQFIQMANAMPEQTREGAKGAQRSQFADFLAQMISLSQEARRQKIDETPSFKAAIEFQTDNTLAGLEYSKIGNESEPAEADVRKYYDNHQSEFVQAKARHILIRFKGSPVPLREGQKDLDEADALTRTLELRKRIAGGEDFAAVAEKESDDTGSGSRGGDLGTFGRGDMVPQFDETVFTMKPGQLSDPVKTQFGYHLIRLESLDAKAYSDVRASLETKLKQTQVQHAVDDVLGKTKVVKDPAFFASPAPPAPATPPAK